MAGSKGSKYYNVFLRYTLNLEDSSDKSILDAEGFELLIKIRKLKSIVAAAKEMGISYRKAWGIINTVEKSLGFPLVHKHRGGAEGGSTELSGEGEQLIDGYTELSDQFDRTTSEIARKFFRTINEKK